MLVTRAIERLVESTDESANKIQQLVTERPLLAGQHPKMGAGVAAS